jgi:hypothetical protein
VFDPRSVRVKFVADEVTLAQVFVSTLQRFSVSSIPFFSWLHSQGLLIIEASRSHSDTPHSVRHLWTSDQPDAETSASQHATITRDRQPCLRAGFEAAIPGSEGAQTDALSRAAHQRLTLTFRTLLLPEYKRARRGNLPKGNAVSEVGGGGSTGQTRSFT